MEEFLKQFEGHSGSQIFLIKEGSKLFVRKINNVKRNYERLLSLQENYPVPKIIAYSDNVLDMEYIHGYDMKTFLLREKVDQLLFFILRVLDNFSSNVKMKDYREVYEYKLQWLDRVSCFSFTKQELIDKLPSHLPQSQYHGDLTLENILWSDRKFYLIDPVTVEYDSYIFDIAKLRQDLECKWFLRQSDLKLDVKLKNLQDKILEKFPIADNKYLIILMLLRVFLHTKEGDSNQKFILHAVRRLWKHLI